VVRRTGDGAQQSLAVNFCGHLLQGKTEVLALVETKPFRKSRPATSGSALQITIHELRGTTAHRRMVASRVQGNLLSTAFPFGQSPAVNRNTQKFRASHSWSRFESRACSDFEFRQLQGPSQMVAADSWHRAAIQIPPAPR
jgi:hypothetical protein